jgi:hypothetical protein
MAGKKKRHILRTILLIIGGIFLALVIIAIFAPEPAKTTDLPPVAVEEEPMETEKETSYAPIDPSKTDLDPEKLYANLESIEEAHLGNVKRYTYNVIIFQRLDKKALEKIAYDMYEQAKTKTPFNALVVVFYDYPQFIGKGHRYGYMNFAPDGKWEEAKNIKTGDYSKMKPENHIDEPNWNYALTQKEAEILYTFFTVSDIYIEDAVTGDELEAAETRAMTETAQGYDITSDEVDILIAKYLGYSKD